MFDVYKNLQFKRSTTIQRTRHSNKNPFTVKVTRAFTTFTFSSLCTFELYEGTIDLVCVQDVLTQFMFVYSQVSFTINIHFLFMKYRCNFLPVRKGLRFTFILIIVMGRLFTNNCEMIRRFNLIEFLHILKGPFS